MAPKVYLSVLNAGNRERLLVYGQIDKAVCNKRGGVRYSAVMLMHVRLQCFHNAK